jgi:IS30 family transposase
MRCRRGKIEVSSRLQLQPPRLQLRRRHAQLARNPRIRRTRARQTGNRLLLVLRRKPPPHPLRHLVPPGRQLPLPPGPGSGSNVTKLAAHVTDRQFEGWTPEQIAGRLRLGIGTGLRAVRPETIYGWVYRAGQKTGRLWRFLTRRHARRRKRHGRASRDTIAEKTHISQRSDDADTRAAVGHREADLVIRKRSRPGLALHARKTRVTLMSRRAGKSAGETLAAMPAAFRRLDPRMRGSVPFDNDPCFARRRLLRGLLSAATYFCDAHASWQKGGVENANGRIRRWLPRGTVLDAISEADVQEIAMTITLTPRKCLGSRFPVEAFLSELGGDARIRLA